MAGDQRHEREEQWFAKSGYGNAIHAREFSKASRTFKGLNAQQEERLCSKPLAVRAMWLASHRARICCARSFYHFWRGWIWGVHPIRRAQARATSCRTARDPDSTLDDKRAPFRPPTPRINAAPISAGPRESRQTARRTTLQAPWRAPETASGVASLPAGFPGKSSGRSRRLSKYSSGGNS